MIPVVYSESSGMSTTDDGDQQLRRRLDRERRARQAAEEIAEKTLRSLYLSNRNLDLLAQVAAVANQAQSTSDALRAALPILVQLGPWDIGVAFMLQPVEDGEGDPQLHAVYRVGNRDRLPDVGSGAHQIGESKRADIASLALADSLWVSDLVKEELAVDGEDLDEGSAAAFPLLTADGVMGSIVLLAPTASEPDDSYPDRAGMMGQQLGAVIDRENRAADREATQRRLAAQVEERTQDLLRVRSRAHAAARSRESLQAILSHELLTPLHAIRNAVDSAPADKSAELASLCTIISESTDRLTSRINDLMDLMDYTTGEVVAVEAEPIRVLEPSLQEFSQLLATDQREITLTTDASAEQELLFDRSAVVAAFEASVALVLANTSGPVGVTLGLSGGNLNISVTATEADRVSSHTLVSQIVSAAGGAVSETVSGGKYGVVARIPATPSIPPRQGTGHRVLLVDDTDVARHLGSGIVRSLGFEVDTAADGLEALDMLSQSTEYALVLMDVGMPRLDGYETTRAIRAGQAGFTAAALPIIALTALTSDADQLRSQLAGMDDFISKPFTRADLADVVNRFVAQ